MNLFTGRADLDLARGFLRLGDQRGAGKRINRLSGVVVLDDLIGSTLPAVSDQIQKDEMDLRMWSPSIFLEHAVEPLYQGAGMACTRSVGCCDAPVCRSNRWWR
jgi:hypothetical protein